MSTSFDTNLKNIHNTLFYDATGNVALRTGFTGNIIISGDVNIPGNIQVFSTPDDPVHTHITEIGTSGNLLANNISWMPIDGNVRATQAGTWYVNINNFPTTQNITGNVNSSITGGNVNVTVTGGNINASLTGGYITSITNVVNVNVLNTPTVNITSGNINANITGGTITSVTNTVNVNVLNTPTVNITSGNINANITGGTITGITNTVNVNVLNSHAVTVTSGNINANITGGTITSITNVVNVNVLNTPSVNVTSGNINANITGGNINATITGTPVVSFGGVNLDAFGRLRVSNPQTLFDGAQRYRDNPLKWNQVDTGSATSTFLPNESSVLMTVSGNGDESLRQTKSVFAYQPGKSLLTLVTFAMTTPTAGLRQRAGLFGAQNGVYFEVDGTTVNLVIRKYTSGSVDDTTEKIPQSSWNGDKLLGTGASGITLILSRSQIFWCDIEWLGVGSVRCGFVIDGQFILCHTFHHANRVGFDKVYMTTATLPIRYELTSTGPAGNMRAICSTVMSEGGYVNRSITRSAGTSLTGKNLSETVYIPLVCIRLKAGNLDAVVVPAKFDVFGLQQSAFVYRIIINPTLTDANWTSAGSDSSVEYDISATALSGGTVIDQGIFVGSNKGGSASITSNEVDFSQQIGRTINGVSDIWCLAAIATTNNDDAVGAVTWQEHT